MHRKRSEKSTGSQGQTPVCRSIRCKQVEPPCKHDKFGIVGSTGQRRIGLIHWRLIWRAVQLDSNTRQRFDEKFQLQPARFTIGFWQNGSLLKTSGAYLAALLFLLSEAWPEANESAGGMRQPGCVQGVLCKVLREVARLLREEGFGRLCV